MISFPVGVLFAMVGCLGLGTKFEGDRNGDGDGFKIELKLVGSFYS